MGDTDKSIVKYTTENGEVTLSPAIVRKYLVSGQGNISDQEVMMFLALCKYQKLNPYLREVYLIKYGTENATMVTGKETFLKRAMKNTRYAGHKTGIEGIEDGNLDKMIAWAEVYCKGYQVPIRVEVDYIEYVGRKKDGKPNRMWATKPRTMLKKVALVQALREAFPDDLGGLYSQEEINTVSKDLPTEEITMPEAVKTHTESSNSTHIDVESDTDMETDTEAGKTAHNESGEESVGKPSPRTIAFRIRMQDFKQALTEPVYREYLQNVIGVKKSSEIIESEAQEDALKDIAKYCKELAVKVPEVQHAK